MFNLFKKPTPPIRFTYAEIDPLLNLMSTNKRLRGSPGNLVGLLVEERHEPRSARVY